MPQLPAPIIAAAPTLDGTPMVAMVFFDEETEEICREQGYTLVLPADSLRRRLDSKIVTTRLGNEDVLVTPAGILPDAGSP